MNVFSSLLRIYFLLMSGYWFAKGDYAHAAFDLLVVVAMLAYEERDERRQQS